MNKTLCFACLCLVGLVVEGECKNDKKPPPLYPQKISHTQADPDLFKRDKQVFSVHTEFLYWRVQEGALDYALKMENTSGDPASSFAQGKFQNTTYGGDPGFRIKLSFFRAPRYWEVWGTYTRLTATGSDSAGKPGPDQVFLTGTWPQIIPVLAGAQSWIHMNYNTADLLVDRFFNPNPHLRLRLIGGGFVAWMDQDWKIHYNDSGSSLTKVRNRWSYTGGGIRIGTMIDWFWGYDIYVTALTTTGLALGNYENRGEQTTNVGNTTGPIRNARYSDVRPAFTVQVQLGPSWQKAFTNNRVEVFAGYELNAWLNLQEIYRSTSATASQSKETWTNTSVLALQGLTTRLTVDF